QTDRLINLYAIGVFLSFTLSQTGMVVRWWRRREPTWRRSLVINLLGATLSAAVLIVVALTKFEEGAWVVVVLIPLVVWTATRVHRHYRRAGEAIALTPPDPNVAYAIRPPRMFRVEESEAAVPSEDAESPDEMTHLTVVPLASMD